MFKIESEKFAGDNLSMGAYITKYKPYSQLYYIVKGKTGTYENIRALKESTIPNKLEQKWIKFFKTGKIVNQ